MAISSKLSKEVIGWSVLIMIVVLFSVILLNFKTDTICPTGYEINLTSSTTACVSTANNSVALTGDTSNTIISTLDTSVTGLQEPANWTSIVVIVIIAVGVIGLILVALYGLRKGGSGGLRFN